MDLQTPIARSTISHWEWKTFRFSLLRYLLTATLLLQYFITSTLNEYITESYYGLPVLCTAVIFLLSAIQFGIETIFASPYSAKPSAKKELLAHLFFAAVVMGLHPVHLAGARRIFSQAGCDEVCGGSAIGSGLLKIGSTYLDEVFATILSIITVWCISPRNAFLQSWLHAGVALVAKYAVSAFLAKTAVEFFWRVYCSANNGDEMCLGNMAVAGWALVWVPMGRQIGHLGPFVDLLGREAMDGYEKLLKGA